MQHEVSGTSLHLLKSLPYCKLHSKGLAVSALKFNSNKQAHILITCLIYTWVITWKQLLLPDGNSILE